MQFNLTPYIWAFFDKGGGDTIWDVIFSQYLKTVSSWVILPPAPCRSGCIQGLPWLPPAPGGYHQPPGAAPSPRELSPAPGGSPRGLPPSPRFSGVWGWGLPQPPSPRGLGAAPGGWGLSQPPGAETVPSFWGQPPKISAPTKNSLCVGGVFRNPAKFKS